MHPPHLPRDQRRTQCVKSSRGGTDKRMRGGGAGKSRAHAVGSATALPKGEEHLRPSFPHASGAPPGTSRLPARQTVLSRWGRYARHQACRPTCAPQHVNTRQHAGKHVPPRDPPPPRSPRRAPPLPLTRVESACWPACARWVQGLAEVHQLSFPGGRDCVEPEARSRAVRKGRGKRPFHQL